MNQPAKSGRHPKGLYVLFFTEMWERFGYYLMVGILFLYLTNDTTGGKGMSNAKGADIVGTFIALVYLTPFIGGFDCRQVSRLYKINFYWWHTYGCRLSYFDSSR